MLIKKDQAKVVDQGTKVIRKYPASDKLLEVNHMILNGRTPVGENTFLRETKVHFMILVIKGSGRIYCGSEIFNVEEGDSVDVPAGTKFAAEGNLEYITAESPAWYKEQATIVDIHGKEI
ncbi:MAG: hypothetical protein AAB801_03345 [Patescibacteria group bacterium]